MLKNKTIKAISIILATGAIITGCTSKNSTTQGNKQEDPTVVTLVLDLGGVNDQSFNQSAFEGAERVALSHNIDLKFLESTKEADYATNIETAVDMDSDLIIGVGFNLTEPIKEAAKNYPHQQFAIVDGSFDTIPENVKPLLFNEEDAGFLAGLAAAKTSKSNNFGFIGGLEVPAVINFKNGFEQGLKEVNPHATLNVQYANSFVDTSKGKAIAQSMHNNDVDIIMTAGGGVNQGVIEACIEKNKYVIGVDMPHAYIAPDFVLTSALKNVDVAVESTILEFLNGDFKGGEASVYDLSNNGVGYEDTFLLKDDIVTFIENIKSTMK